MIGPEPFDYADEIEDDFDPDETYVIEDEEDDGVSGGFFEYEVD